MDKERLIQICKEMRQDCIVMADAAGSSGMHFGGSLSMIEIIAALYLDVMHIDPDNLIDEKRDRMILSKGHGVPAVYAALKQLEILTEEDIRTFKQDNTVLSGHPSMNENLGIEFSTGSLGQGLSLGVGTAIALKHHGNNMSRVYVVLGDGECDEGSVWEAAMSAAKFELDNLIVIVDKNNLQYDGCTEKIMPLKALEEKFKSFGWSTVSIDGNDIEQCCNAFKTHTNNPLAVIANTIKGKGISFMENDPYWHHAKMTTSQREIAIKEVSGD
jgi:transketolase